MSGLSLYLTAGIVPQGTQLPPDSQALINMVAQYIGVAGGGTFNGVNFGSTTPPPSARNLPWFKTDSIGNPIGWYSWNGTDWTAIPTNLASGPTSMRPASPTQGQVYWDTTIGAAIVWITARNAWTTLAGTPGDVKEVTATTLDAALAANPGWRQHTESTGLVIGAAGDATGITVAHAQGQIIGEESHQLSVAELASHSHTEIYATNDGQFQNGPQATGVYPAVTPGSKSLPFASTNTSGGNSAHNNIQPTMYLYRLVKSY